MSKVDKLWFTLLSEILVNLSAGWAGVGLAIPLATDTDIFIKFALLMGNMGFAILSVVAAFKLRKKVRK